MKRQIIITEENKNVDVRFSENITCLEMGDILATLCAEIIMKTANIINAPVDNVMKAMILSIKLNVSDRENKKKTNSI